MDKLSHYASQLRNLAYIAVDDWRAGAAAADGFAYPPLRLIRRITGPYPKRGFVNSGKSTANRLFGLLRSNDIEPERFEMILDFGSGAGRVIRHLRDLPARLFGVEIDPECVDWCARALAGVATFHCNRGRARVPLPDASVDFVYSLSVFTHLDDGDFDFWFDELKRLVRPGGYFYVTLNGAVRARDVVPTKLTAEQMGRFDRGERVVVNAGRSGDNRFVGPAQCYTFTPESYVRSLVSEAFEIIAFLPGARALEQDQYLLRRRGSHDE